MIMRSAIHSTFVAAMSMLASGCVCVDNFSAQPGGCPDGACGSADSCSQCSVDTCSHCDGIGCPACHAKSPGHLLRGIMHGAGCGQVYWDEWMNDPPYCCDPCDDHSQWSGPRCCGPSITNAWKRLWGHRNHEGGGCGGNACLQPHVPMHDGQMIEGEVIYDGPAIEPAKLGHANARKLPVKEVSVLKRPVRSQRPYYQRGG